MDKITNLFTSLLNNENYVSVIGIIAAAISAYQIARFNALAPHRLKIKQQQLDCVYLPLYRLFINDSGEMTLEKASQIQKQLNTILDKHYEYVFPQLHKLNLQLLKAIQENQNYVQILSVISHQVSIDYELLKRSLGYPSEKIFSLFIRMTPKKKFEFILGYLNISWIPIIFAVSALKVFDISSTSGKLIFLYTLSLLFLNYFYSHSR